MKIHTSFNKPWCLCFSWLFSDMLQRAYKVLEQHPQVLSSRIGMLGLSMGASMTLKMAVYSQVIKVSILQLKVNLIVLT